MATKKKPEVWYGVCHVSQDLKVREIKIIKETATRIYLHEDSQVGWNQKTTYCNKIGGYEYWYPTREEAVKAKLKWLRSHVRGATEGLAWAKENLKKFEAQNA